LCNCNENDNQKPFTEYRIGAINGHPDNDNECKENKENPNLMNQLSNNKINEKSRSPNLNNLNETHTNDLDTSRTDFPSDNKDSHIMERRVSYNDRSEYFGKMLNKQRNGKGTFRDANGNVFEGEWRNDLYHGQGKLTCENGVVYQGSFVNGKKDGVGRLEVGEGKAVYEGEFKEDEKHGKAKESYPDGSYYEGMFVNGKKCGKGIYSLSDGSYYEGEFLNDNIHGIGTFKWNDNRTYSGEWKENSIHGFGVLIKAGKRYEGFFENDKKHGLGIYLLDGENKCIVGNFCENAINGLALQFNGKTFEKYMRMENNKIVKVIDKVDEIKRLRKTDEFVKIMIFLDEVKLRTGREF